MPRFILDHPLVRASISCPCCGENKHIGCVTCWPCHNVIEGEHGTKDMRDIREAALDIEELRLEEEQRKQFAIFAGQVWADTLAEPR
jgi:hypothetical protein